MSWGNKESQLPAHKPSGISDTHIDALLCGQWLVSLYHISNEPYVWWQEGYSLFFHGTGYSRLGNVIYRIAVQLVSMITVRNDFKKSHLLAVLIADDTDLPKTGRRIEMIGKIFSHVHQKYILGYKSLMLCWSDGRTRLMLDVSLHGEMGKTQGKEQGLSATERKDRYSCERDKESQTAKREKEYFMNKGEKLIEKVKRAIKAKIQFEYLLVDSWFTNFALIDFVCKCHKRFHLLGMAKMGNTMYKTLLFIYLTFFIWLIIIFY